MIRKRSSAPLFSSRSLSNLDISTSGFIFLHDNGGNTEIGSATPTLKSLVDTLRETFGQLGDSIRLETRFVEPDQAGTEHAGYVYATGLLVPGNVPLEKKAEVVRGLNDFLAEKELEVPTDPGAPISVSTEQLSEIMASIKRRAAATRETAAATGATR